MKHFSGYGAYLLFLALRTHFTRPSYDFFRMKGKLRATKESYDKRKDKMFFEKIAKRYNAEELKNFYVANFLEDKHYIIDMIDDIAHGVYFDYEKRRQSLAYIFKNDLDRVFEHGCKYAFNDVDSDYPHIVGLILNRTIAIESAIILNDYIPYVNKFNKYFENDDVIWSRVALKLSKYRPFLHYDAEKFKAILKEKVNESIGR